MKNLLSIGIGAALVLGLLATLPKALPPALQAEVDDALRAASAPDVATNPIANALARAKLERAARSLELAGEPSRASDLRRRAASLPQLAPPPILGPGAPQVELPQVPAAPPFVPAKPAGAPPLTAESAAKLVADLLAKGDPQDMLVAARELEAANLLDAAGQLRQRAGDIMLATGEAAFAPGGPPAT